MWDAWIPFLKVQAKASRHTEHKGHREGKLGPYFVGVIFPHPKVKQRLRGAVGAFTSWHQGGSEVGSKVQEDLYQVGKNTQKATKIRVQMVGKSWAAGGEDQGTLGD